VAAAAGGFPEPLARGLLASRSPKPLTELQPGSSVGLMGRRLDVKK